MPTYTADTSQSLASQIKALVPGDTLEYSGEYRWVERVSLTPPEGVTLRGLRVDGIFYVNQGRGVIVEDLDIIQSQPAREHMAKIQGGVGVVFRNTHAHDYYGTAGLLISGGATGWLVDGGRFGPHKPEGATSASEYHGLYVSSASGGIVRRVLSVGHPMGRNAKNGPPSSGGGPHNNRYEYCTFVGANAGNISFSQDSRETELYRCVFAQPGSNRYNVDAYSLNHDGSSIVVQECIGQVGSGKGLASPGLTVIDSETVDFDVFGDYAVSIPGYGHLAGVVVEPPPDPEPEPTPEPEPVPDCPCAALQAQIDALTTELAATDAALVEVAGERDVLRSELARYTLETTPLYRRG